MNKDTNSILIKNKEVINLVTKLFDEKYERERYMKPINRIDVILEALKLMEAKYERCEG